MYTYDTWTGRIYTTCTYTVHDLQVNDRVLFEGVLKIYWGVKNSIFLAPGAAYAKQRHNRQSIYDFVGVDDGAYLMMLEEASKAQMRRELQEGEKKRLREITENSFMASTGQLCHVLRVCVCVFQYNNTRLACEILGVGIYVHLLLAVGGC